MLNKVKGRFLMAILGVSACTCISSINLKADYEVEDNIIVVDADSIDVVETVKIGGLANQLVVDEVDSNTENKATHVASAQINGVGIGLGEEVIKTAEEKAWDEETAYCMSHPDNVLDGVGICNSDNITYMRYTCVTSVTSKQYKLLRGSDCYTDMETGIRMVGDRYCIAVGTGYASEIGTKIDVVMESGEIVKCILGDVKSDAHTDSATHTYHVGGYVEDVYYEGDGSVVEMIVDPAYFSSTSQYPDKLKGRVKKVVVLEREF